MDFKQLRAFVTVAQEANLTRAAARLHMSQPTLSLQLKALQDDLGLRLFVRNATGMTTTPQGAQLLGAAERALQELEQFQRAADSLRVGDHALSGSLAIGTILDPEFLRLGELLNQLVEHHPHVKTRLRQFISGAVLNELLAEELDVGFYLGDPGRRFHSVTLTQFHYSVVAPPGWKTRVAGKGWRELARLPWITTPPESVHYRLLEVAFRKEKVSPHSVAQVDQEASMLALLKSGVGLCLVREAVALTQAHSHALVIADAVRLQTDLRMVALESRKDVPEIAAAFALAQAVWRD